MHFSDLSGQSDASGTSQSDVWVTPPPQQSVGGGQWDREVKEGRQKDRLRLKYKDSDVRKV